MDRLARLLFLRLTAITFMHTQQHITNISFASYCLPDHEWNKSGSGCAPCECVVSPTYFLTYWLYLHLVYIHTHVQYLTGLGELVVIGEQVDAYHQRAIN